MIVIGSAFVAKYPRGGGNFWVPLQYLRGLRELGYEAFWLEVLETTGDAAKDRSFIAAFLQRAAELRILPWTVLAFYPSGFAAPEQRTLFGMNAAELNARACDALLLNLTGGLEPALREPFARTVLVDLDPGLFQLWAAEYDMGVGRHDAHVTIGQHLGGPDCPIPLGGVEWIRTWPTVHLGSWRRVQPSCSRYTTVTQWWSSESARLDGEVYDCSKRNSFVRVVDLPQRVPVSLELAANIHPIERDERARFTAQGWRLALPERDASTPQRYRRYIQRSRGEFSCAKPAYVKGRTGWVSDRTLCYLASGLPCVVEDTGAAAHLPPSSGLRVFSTVEEAAEGLIEIEQDYDRAATAARTLAEDVFSTGVVLPQLLRAVGA